MTSKEIAELTGKRHKDTLQRIRNLVEKGLIQATEIQLPRIINDLGHTAHDEEHVVNDVGFELNKIDSLRVMVYDHLNIQLGVTRTDGEN